jgi:hypothetical protein
VSSRKSAPLESTACILGDVPPLHSTPSPTSSIETLNEVPSLPHTDKPSVCVDEEEVVAGVVTAEVLVTAPAEEPDDTVLYSSNIRPHSPFEVKAQSLPPVIKTHTVSLSEGSVAQATYTRNISLDESTKQAYKANVTIDEKSNVKEETSFRFQRSLWEKRVAGDVDPPRVSASRDFWEQQSKLQKQKQTPDLVMDLPILGTSPKSDSPQESPKILEPEQEEAGRGLVVTTVSTAPATGVEGGDMTGAERFAESSQCTLKKNTPGGKQSLTDAETQTAEKNNTANKGVKSEVVTITGVGSRTPKMTSKYSHFSSLSTDNTASSASVEISSFKPQAKGRPTVKKKPALPCKPSPELYRKFDDPDNMEVGADGGNK